MDRGVPASAWPSSGTPFLGLEVFEVVPKTILGEPEPNQMVHAAGSQCRSGETVDSVRVLRRRPGVALDDETLKQVPPQVAVEDEAGALVDGRKSGTCPQKTRQ